MKKINKMLKDHSTEIISCLFGAALTGASVYLYRNVFFKHDDTSLEVFIDKAKNRGGARIYCKNIFGKDHRVAGIMWPLDRADVFEKIGDAFKEINILSKEED